MKKNSYLSMTVLGSLCMGALLLAGAGTSQPTGTSGSSGSGSSMWSTDSFFNKKTDTSKKTDTKPVPSSKKAPILPKPVLPLMLKPFGIPGIIGLENDRWIGTDYLGYLTKNIFTSIELVSNEHIPTTMNEDSIRKIVNDLFTKNGLNPHSDVKEGPPLPFLHLLLIIYPIDHDKFVVVGASRLFEQIQVIRKDFEPAGIWQAITWENQEIVYSTAEQLDAQVKFLTDRLTMNFIKRYQVYNKLSEIPK